MFEVSIIISVHNVKEHLKRAIESALNQKQVLAEVILVDDGSTDGSAAICDDYARQEPLLIKVIHQEYNGTGHALNTGIDQAIGKYIYVVNPEDYFDNTLLQDNIRLVKETNADMVVFGYTQESASNPQDREQKLPNFPQLPNQESFRQHYRNVHQSYPYVLWNKIYKKAFLNRHHIRFTGQPVGQEALFNLHVSKYISSVAVNRLPYYHHVLHNHSLRNGYLPESNLMELNIARTFEELMKEWGEEYPFNDLISEEYFHVIYEETDNLVRKNCPLNQAEKVERLSKLWELIGKEKVLPHKDGDRNPFKSLLLSAYKQENFKRALLLMKNRNQISYNFAKILKNTRLFFKN